MIAGIITAAVVVAIGVSSGGSASAMNLTSRDEPKYQGDKDKY